VIFCGKLRFSKYIIQFLHYILRAYSSIKHYDEVKDTENTSLMREKVSE